MGRTLQGTIVKPYFRVTGERAVYIERYINTHTHTHIYIYIYYPATKVFWFLAFQTIGVGPAIHGFQQTLGPGILEEMPFHNYA